MDEIIDGRRWFDYSLRRFAWRGDGIELGLEAFSGGMTFGQPKGIDEAEFSAFTVRRGSAREGSGQPGGRHPTLRTKVAREIRSLEGRKKVKARVDFPAPLG